MYSALILDDEEAARRTLHGLLSRYCPEIVNIYTAADIQSASEIMEKYAPDFLFFDVALGNHTSFDVHLQANLSGKALIFVTAHEEFSLQALKAGALDYLLKPVDIDELKLAVKKGSAFLGKEKRMQAHTEENAPREIKLMVNHGSGFNLLNGEDILFAQADGNYTTFHLQGHKKIMSAKQIGFYEELLPPQLFFRSHKSYIINIRYLEGYSFREGHAAHLSEGHEVPVSRRKLPQFIELCKRLKI